MILHEHFFHDAYVSSQGYIIPKTHIQVADFDSTKSELSNILTIRCLGKNLEIVPKF